MAPKAVHACRAAHLSAGDLTSSAIRPVLLRKRRSPRGLRHPLLEHDHARTKVVRTATASERPSVGHGRTRGNEPARIPLWHPGQYEVLTNDEPRDQPTRPETRPNQRLYVPLGSPPSVAVGSPSARAAHRSCAPPIYLKNDWDKADSKAKNPGNYEVDKATGLGASVDGVVPIPRHSDLLGKLDHFSKARGVVAQRSKALEQRVIVRILDGRRS